MLYIVSKVSKYHARVFIDNLFPLDHAVLDYQLVGVPLFQVSSKGK